MVSGQGLYLQHPCLGKIKEEASVQFCFRFGCKSFHRFPILMRFHLCAVFHVVDQEGNKLYNGQVIDRIEQVIKYKQSPLVAANQWHYLVSKEQSKVQSIVQLPLQFASIVDVIGKKRV